MVDAQNDIKYVTYEEESQLETMIKMIESELSEPYSIFTYRYFVKNWPHLSFLAYHKEEMIGVIIGKLERHGLSLRGYIAMIVVKKEFRKLKIGKKLVELFIDKVRELKGDEVVLETESVNIPALRLYETLGFAKDKRLMNYYMNGNDAFRLKLWLRKEPRPMTEANEKGPEAKEQETGKNENEAKEKGSDN